MKQTKVGLGYDLLLTNPVNPVGVMDGDYKIRRLRLEVKEGKQYTYLTILNFRTNNKGTDLEVEPLFTDQQNGWIVFNEHLRDSYNATLPRYNGGKTPTQEEINKYADSIEDVLDNLHMYVKGVIR
jgi:hypothetical protein